MGYALCLWRDEGDAPAEPRAVYRALSTGQPVAGITRFPIRPFLTALDTAWAGREREVNHPRFRAYRFSESAVVEVAWTDGHVLVTLRPYDPALADDVIAAGRAVDARLYDPQHDERSSGAGDD